MTTPQETPINRKPLVFISAATKNSAWRDRLTKKLDGYSDQIEWWDISKLKRDQYDFQEDQIDAAIARASVAVLLFSDAYLSSALARAEMEELRKRAEANRLRLFPIVLEISSWADIPPLPVQVLHWTRQQDDGS